MSTKVGNLPIITKHFGNLEVIKEVLNGVVVYQNAPSVVYPTISDIIFIDLDGNGKKPYRVLKNVSGTTYEIMSMDDGIITAQRYSSSSQNYSGSEIDTRLNSTFYNTLTQTAKSSIVDKTYDIYQYNNNNGQLGTRVNSPTTITRHIYTIDADMINEYLTATSSNLNDMLWCGYYPSLAVRIGTATGVRYGYYYSILGSTSSITTASNYAVTNNSNWRPVMQIDLSKIEFLLDCYKVAVKFAETNTGKKTSSAIYDGQSNSGELVYSISGSYVPSNFSVVPITSGYLYWEFRGTSVKITSITKTGTITINGQTNDNYATISSDGAITFTINYNG